LRSTDIGFSEDNKITLKGRNKNQEFKMTEQTINRIRQFVADRDWGQYHSPANLAKSISIEANELLECFQWSDTEYDLQHVKEELADVLVYCRDLLDKLDLDEDEIVNMKMDMNEKKYPADKARGNNKKYTEL
jgi:NTP pyrophosphatase (non-canonical NTP hydrolase)